MTADVYGKAPYVMRCLALADGSPGPGGQMLKDYHQESGFSEWTVEPEEAMKFDSVEEAFRLYQSVLPSQPVRPWDGRPNRPLTAFCIEIRPLSDSSAWGAD